MLAASAELERIVGQYQDMVWRIALSMTKNQYDAEDVFQDVFVRLVDSIGRIESEEHLKAWLIRVTVNRCRSWSKSSWKRKVDSYERKHEELGDRVEPVSWDQHGAQADERFDPEMAQTLLGEQVMSVLQRMDQPYRVVVYLFYYENLSVREIADVLDVKENAVRTRLSRARDRIREGVNQHG